MMKRMNDGFRWVRAWLTEPYTFPLLLVALLPIVFLVVFIAFYAPSTPIHDTAGLNGTVLISIRDGSFQWVSLVANFNGHRPFFTRLLSIANYYLTDWDQRFESFAMLGMALVNVCLLLGLVGHFNRGGVRWALLPTLFLLLSPMIGLTWLSAAYTSWHFNLMFVLLGLLMIAKLPQRWWSLLLIAVVSIFPMLSLTQGILMWGMGVVALYVVGYRKLPMYAVYTVVGTAAVALYIRGSVFDFNADPARDASLHTISLESPVVLLRFVLTYLGAPLGAELPTLALALGAVGCVMLALQTLYVARRGELRRVWVLLLLALYCVGTAALVGLGRMDYLGIEAAMQERYQHSGLVFWLTVTLVILVALRVAQNAAHGVLAQVNMLLLTVLASFFFISAHWQTPTYVTIAEPTPLTIFRELDECTAIVLLRNENAPCLEYSYYTLARQFAAMGVSGYDEVDFPIAVTDPALASGYAIVMMENAWSSYFVHRHMLPGAPHERASLLLPDGTQDDYNRILELSDVPVPAAYTHNDADALRTQVAGAPGVWLVHDESLDTEPVLTLNDADYALLRRWRQRYDIAVQHYLPLHTGEQQFQFGDEMTLVGWQIPAALEVAPCSTLPLHTFWRAAVDEGERANSYGLSLVLAGADGVGVSAANGATSLDTTDWRAEHYYADARTVEIPCDAPTGEYPLLLSAYPLDEPGANLPVTAEDGTPLGDFLYLTTVFIAQ